jgi:actin-like ATPase involved in cell morphogenesis
VSVVGEGGARLGIDFGTANTVAVLALPGREPRPLLFDGSPQLPSAACLDPGGRLLVGRDALHTATAEPASFEPHPKRCIDDATVLLGERDVPVADLIGAVLRRVSEEAARVAGAPPAEAVLTCPASWGTSRRSTLLDAAAASLPTVRLVSEPVAAARHFIQVTDALPVGGTALVYDFGAGTFDASVVRRDPDGFEILAAEGLADCGGLDVDASIVAYLGAVLRERDPAAWSRLASPETAADRRASRQLWDNVRAGKEMLSRATSTLVHVPLLDLDVPLGRDQLEEMAAPILERTVKACRAALRDAGVAPDGLAAVFLAGGSSRMPAAATALHRALGVAPTIVDQPELAVAEGSVREPATPDPAPADADDPSWPAGAVGSAPARPVPGDTRRRQALLAGAAVLAVLLVVTLAVALIGRDDDPPGPGDGAAGPAGKGSPAASNGAVGAPLATPTPTYPPGVDPCLLGTWRRTGKQKEMDIYGTKVYLTGGGGQVDTFRADGTVSVRWTNDRISATHKGVRWAEVVNGTVEAKYRASNGNLIYTNARTTGTWRLLRNNGRNNGGKLQLSLEPESYSCSGDSLTIAASFYSLEYVRMRLPGQRG